MTMDWKDLRALAERDDRDGPVVSLYLNLGDPGRIDTELNSLVRTASQGLEADGRFDREQRKALDRLLKDLHERVKAEVGPETRERLLVVFADPGGLWRELRLPAPLPSRMVIQEGPCTLPLTRLLDAFPRYRVLVADTRSARLFALQLGAFEEAPGFLVRDEVPDRVSAKKSMAVSAWGVYSGMGDQKIQRHVEDHLHRHLVRVAERLFDTHKKDPIQRLILAAPDEGTVSRVRDHLHSDLQRRVLGTFNARPEDADPELREKALATAREVELLEERALVERIADLHHSGGLGAQGLEPVLSALRMGQVHTLVLKEDFSAEGYACPHDGRLSAGEAPCPACGEPLQPVERFAEEIVQEALTQGAEIAHVGGGDDRFDAYGIGALLRFRV